MCKLLQLLIYFDNYVVYEGVGWGGGGEIESDINLWTYKSKVYYTVEQICLSLENGLGTNMGLKSFALLTDYMLEFIFDFLIQNTEVEEFIS